MNNLNSILKDKINSLPKINFPHEYSVKDYLSARNNYIEEIINYNTIKSIYQIGSIGKPGLSDIDLVIIFKNSKRDIWKRYAINTLLDKKSQYLFSHDGWFVNEYLFNNLSYIIPHDNLENVYGPELNPPIKLGDCKNLLLIHLILLLLTKMPIDIIKYSIAKECFNVRIIENMLNSVCYTIRMSQKFSKNLIKHDNYIFRYKNFRSEYFKFSEKKIIEYLILFISESLLIVAEIIEEMNKFLLENIFKVYEKEKRDIKLNNSIYSFIENWNSEEFLKIIINTNGYRILYPMGFLNFIILYTGSNGLIGSNIRKKIGKKQFTFPVVNNEFNLIFTKHLNLVDDYANFYSKKFGKPLAFYYGFGAKHTNSFFKYYLDKGINFSLSKFFEVNNSKNI
jgi:hypothetical protein